MNSNYSPDKDNSKANAYILPNKNSEKKSKFLDSYQKTHHKEVEDETPRT